MKGFLFLPVLVIIDGIYLSPLVSTFSLTLLHVNDIHVRIDETNKYSNTCKDWDKANGKCFGGISRLHSAVKEFRSTRDNVLWVNAGDFFQGTAWYSQFKWRVVSVFNNMLDFDAITLGNHEFDDRIIGLTPFLKEQTSPVVVTNLNHTLVPEMAGLYVKSVVKTIGSRRVGIVGYLTPKTKQISLPENLIFLDEIEALKQEVEHLHNDGVDIIVALGHSGYEKDLEVARLVPHLDVIVGGHSHSFLYTETSTHKNPSGDEIIGPYPTMVNNTGGGRVLVVQAFAYTKFLGKVDLKFSEDGHLISWTGDPILLDNRVAKDAEMEVALEPWRQNLTESTKMVVGEAAVLLEIERTRETNLGNLLTDIMVWTYQNRSTNGEPITLAITNTGSIRNNIDQGNITKGDLLTTFPFGNTLDLLTLTGATLLKILEFSVKEMKPSGKMAKGSFLQVSGFKTKYDLRNEPGSRLISSQALRNGVYEPVSADGVYNVVIPDYIAAGGDGYEMIKNEKIEQLQGYLDIDMVEEYLKLFSPVSAKVEGRILIRTSSMEDDPSSDENNTGSTAAVSQIFFSLAFIHVCIAIYIG